MAHEIIKDFLKNSHFEDMIAGFPSHEGKYPWNHAFSGMKKIDFHQNCLILVIALTKYSLY